MAQETMQGDRGMPYASETPQFQASAHDARWYALYTELDATASRQLENMHQYYGQRRWELAGAEAVQFQVMAGVLHLMTSLEKRFALTKPDGSREA